ncbi:Acetyl-CoA:oxalate CoA-transferase [BD1-7 clade bacterium]|uniref:Acetyl-CoA:oxalate CoA-transferase n=1 Tax=BD1-7 clade bacterium TaxID=2029982 RepID=A0A5S9R0K0_9GAMM|nr:Acetyl-CoA:oxalate CoA-transferase [BD1-7 clade bacterium]
MAAPLKGLKILDFTPLLPGPYATMLLADMGADVLRIEAPDRPDFLRLMPPYIEEGVSAAQASINRNKKSMALNLKHPEAASIVMKLLDEYDIIIEQYRPGVMARLGLDYSTLSKTHPELIYCSITGFGQSGPLSQAGGHDINYLSLGGLASYSGRENTGPVLNGTQIADVAGGSHHAVMGILAAVIQRQTSGTGQHVDISMTDAVLSMNTIFAASHLADEQVPGLGTEQLNGGIFYDYYETFDGRWLAIGGLEPKFCQAFCSVIDKPEWLERFFDYSTDTQNALKSDITDEIKKRTFADWQDKFSQADACVSPVLNLAEATSHPHFIERQMICDAQLSNGDTVKQIACPIRFGNTRQASLIAGTALGTQNYATLSALGYSEEAIRKLTEEGAISG